MYFLTFRQIDSVTSDTSDSAGALDKSPPRLLRSVQREKQYKQPISIGYRARPLLPSILRSLQKYLAKIILFLFFYFPNVKACRGKKVKSGKGAEAAIL